MSCICFVLVGCEENQVAEENQPNLQQKNQVDSENLVIQNAEWMQENQARLSEMTREEIAQLNGSLQREIFRSLAPEGRKALWLDKIEHLKTIVDSEEEIDFLLQFEDKVLNLTFDESWTEQDNTYHMNMLSNAMENFNWSKNFVIYAFFTLHDMNKKITPENDFFGMFESEEGGVIEGLIYSGFDPLPDCNCNWGYCPGSSCEDIDCYETVIGCSFLNLGPCDEKCKNPF